MEEKNEKIKKLEALVMHRELQYLRVLGLSAKMRRRPLTLGDLRQSREWVSTRFRKLEEARRILSKEKRDMKNRK